ncbi:MAG: helix-turn-helix domain-containing protein [Alphaproteobacteria bacterium]|jgi:phage repressor protein C with HTH and peptisase S24 domain|nr:helix-turn-helix domain-containing protein [Alphaproteobacteria bacterium]
MFPSRPDPTAVLGRLAAVLDAASDTDLAQKLGVARGTVSSWRARGAVPVKDCLAAAHCNDISLEWLINGRGPKFVGDLEADPGCVATAPMDPYGEFLLRNYSLVGKGGVKLAPDGGALLPFPENSFPVAFKSRYLANLTDNAPESCQGYVCDDDCMEPTIPNGWCVLVSRTDNSIGEPGIYAIVFLESSRQTFRRLTPTATELHLACDNPAYPPTTFDLRTERCPFSVLGRAVWAGGFVA